ncbi:C-type mannose receptor 2-like, partial [Silurus asotus]
HHYDLVIKLKTWTDAINYCRANFTDLAKILSDTDWLRFKKELARKGLVEPVWVGLYNDIDSWRWSLNNLPLKYVTYTNWYPGEPQNLYGIESCVAMGSDNRWYDVPCSQLRTFICYNVSVSVLRTAPYHYDLIMTPSTWKDAQAYCRLMYTDLATVLSDTDWLRVKKVSTSKGLITPAWSGLYNDIYNWRWAINNVPLTDTNYTNWSPGQPDNYKRFEMCTIIADNNQWYDEICYSLQPFICYDGGIPHKYDLIMTKMPWADAQIYCREKYTDIATVVSNADSQRLNKEAASKGLATPAWVGLYDDIKSWRWSLNNLLLLDVGYTSWSSGQPNNALSLESCVAVGVYGNWYDTACYFVRAIVCYDGNNQWYDINCYILRPFICYDVVNSILQNVTHKYYLIMTPVTWSSAQNYCRVIYTDLATIESDNDWVRFNKLITSQHIKAPFWVGLYNDIDSWRWSFNEVPLQNTTFRKWGSGDPDNNHGRESCGIINNDGYWWDAYCYDLRPFICYNVIISIMQAVPHEYHLITTKVTWSSAQNYCRLMYTDLANIETDNDWVRLNKLITSQNIKTAFWVGLYNDINSWRWSFNEVPLQYTTFRQWGSGEPNNYKGRESCAIINNNGYWWDAYCYDLRPFICYNSTNSGADMFVGVTSPRLTWSDAQTYCRTFHTDLATVTNSADNKLLAQLASVMSSICYWIGLYRDTWKWSDGTKVSNLQWSNRQPNNYWKNENCGLHYTLFEDDNCTNLRFFMCHTIIISIMQTVPHEYHLITTKVTWSSAQNYCRVMYTDLATIESDNDWVRLNKLITSQNIKAPFWVGLYNDIDSWRWSFNEVPLQYTTFRQWGSGDPDNNKGRESCGIINNDGYWWDAYCYDLRPFICYNSTNSGADRFVAVTSPMLTWSDAQTYCRTFYTDLATVTNSTDNDLLAQLASVMSSISYWIGLYRDTWKWSDGTTVSNLQWSNRQPNNYWKNENC